MARQTGIIQFSGPLGGISFYKHKKYGMLARACNPVSAQRIAKDPAFARTRENGTEFGMASRAGKLLRDGLHGFLQDVPAEELDLRVMRLMMDLKAQDTVSVRGQRQVGIALGLQPGLLGDFALSRCRLDRSVVQSPVTDRQAGTITLRGGLDNVPKQATHVVFTGFRGQIDFAQGERDFVFSESIEMSLGEPARDVVLTLPEPAAPVAAIGVELWGLKVVFLQEMNGVRYALKVGAAGILQSFEIAVVETAGVGMAREELGDRVDPGEVGVVELGKGGLAVNGDGELVERRGMDEGSG
jgi:hypothetical protein